MKRIMEAHGSEVVIDSRHGGGAAIKLVLPVGLKKGFPSFPGSGLGTKCI